MIMKKIIKVSLLLLLSAQVSVQAFAPANFFRGYDYALRLPNVPEKDFTLLFNGEVFALSSEREAGERIDQKDLANRVTYVSNIIKDAKVKNF